MTVTSLNPEGLVEPQGYQQVAIATGSRMVFVSGQVSDDATGEVIGEGDLAAQVEQCYLNIGAALAGAGGSFDNVAKLTIYITEWTIEKMPLVEEGRSRAFAKLGVTALAPGTLIGVAALFVPDHHVEIEAIAIID